MFEAPAAYAMEEKMRDSMAAFGMPAPAPPMALRAASLSDMAARQADGHDAGRGAGRAVPVRHPDAGDGGTRPSAMVPVVSAMLDYQKDLLYNGSKMPAHPVATLRLKNASGLTLERGPVTVLESGEYVGEAVLPFTAANGEIVVPYSVELSTNVIEASGSSRQIYRLSLKGIYLHIEDWEVVWREYRVSNKSGKEMTVLVEHPRSSAYDLFDTPQPKERTDEQLRFAVTVPAWGESKLKVQERRLLSHREEVRQQSHQTLQQYLKQGLMDQRVYDQIVKLLMLYDTISDYEKKLKKLDEERNAIYQAQKQIQGNMGALSTPAKKARCARATWINWKPPRRSCAAWKSKRPTSKLPSSRRKKKSPRASSLWDNYSSQ
jgi:hypothetical protein